MIVSHGYKVFLMTENGDEVDEKLNIQGFRADKKVEDITSGDGHPIITFPDGGEEFFPKSIIVNGLRRGFGVGILYVYTA